MNSRNGLSRRGFLVGSGMLATAAWLPHVGFAGTGGSARLIVVILRGALDGLAAVPPVGDPDYAALHAELAIGVPGTADGAIRLNDTFGLHPSFQFLGERYAAGELTVFHAISSPYRDRSHFDGQNVLENGLGHPAGGADGWLNRALAALPRTESAVAVSQNVPLILRGDAPVMSKSPQHTPGVDEELLTRLQDLYSHDDWFSQRLSEALSTEKMADDAREGAVSAPAMQNAAAERINPTARMAASLMRSENGPQVAVFEATGWDTHANQGGAKGLLAQRLAGLDRAVATLAQELGPLWSDTAVLIVTEFGRTAAMNGTRGTDHGTGGCALLVGGAVRGGRVIADWPGLKRGALLDGRDLKPTLDLRSVFKGVLEQHLHVDARSLSDRIFPDSAGARPLQGLMRA